MDEATLADARHPLLFQLNTRVCLTTLGRELGRPATLDDIANSRLDALRDQGFTWLWPLGVWQTGPIGRNVARTDEALRAGYADVLPDFRDEDIVSSPFAIQRYSVNHEYGGDAALARLRRRLAERGIWLMLDFVVNHIAPDHSWLSEYPERFIEGNEQHLARAPLNWGRFATRHGRRILAYGRDPHFPGWRDTLQLDYRRASLRAAMIEQLATIAERSDGVRCDMAMLVEPDVFERTWGELADGSERYREAESFWPLAIGSIRRRFPRFVFAAEVYWNLESRLQQHGFDYTYDKGLYDRLRAGRGKPVREHLRACLEHQSRSIRFLENHDEARAAAAFPRDKHQAAALITYFTPGMRFFHDGQFEGRRAHVPMQLRRRPDEPPDRSIHAFYERVLECLCDPLVHERAFHYCQPRPAWEGNSTYEDFIAFTWHGPSDRLVLGVANYAETAGQCYVPFACPAGSRVVLHDRLGRASYERNGAELCTPGLYLDLPAWGFHLFAVEFG